MKKTGALIISLDFELMWGMFDKVTEVTYGKNIEQVHQVVPKLLALFSERNIHATWATVGMLTCNDRLDLLQHLPETQPTYSDPQLSAYQHLQKNTVGKNESLYFAPHLVRQITETPGQELASHTFSHFYCQEQQINLEDAFRADCKAMNHIIGKYEVVPKAIVFPRNQWNEAVLKTLKDFSFLCFRGTESHFLYSAKSDKNQRRPWLRALRLIDHYCNLSGHHTYTIKGTAGQSLVNIPASRFLRPFSPRLALLESLRLRRIKRAMTHAAKTKTIFHLWWHPHNFGSHQKENFTFLEKILEHYRMLNEKYGMQSLTMTEVATQASESTVEGI